MVARVNYTRFSKATTFDFDETLDKIIASAQKFNADKVKQDDVAKAAGGPPTKNRNAAFICLSIVVTWP